jgi:hypothetical protein
MTCKECKNSGITKICTGCENYTVLRKTTSRVKTLSKTKTNEELARMVVALENKMMRISNDICEFIECEE